MKYCTVLQVIKFIYKALSNNSESPALVCFYSGASAEVVLESCQPNQPHQQPVCKDHLQHPASLPVSEIYCAPAFLQTDVVVSRYSLCGWREVLLPGLLICLLSWPVPSEILTSATHLAVHPLTTPAVPLWVSSLALQNNQPLLYWKNKQTLEHLFGISPNRLIWNKRSLFSSHTTPSDLMRLSEIPAF